MAPGAGIAPASSRLQRDANLSQLPGARMNIGSPSRSIRKDWLMPKLCEGWLAEPKLGERRLVVQRGNAPRSFAYRASALLLSYWT